MSKKKNIEQEKGIESIENTLTKSEQFIEKNQKTIMYIVFGLIVIVGIYWAYMKFYKQPREKQAISQMFVAQQNFQVDSFKLALNGNLNYPGFVSIIQDYSGTKAANLANYYAGVCYMNLGQYDNAIKYLKKFNAEGDLLLGSEKYGLIGDAYVQKDQYKNAVDYYKDASSSDYSNDFTTPIYLKKLGLVYEKLGKYNEALKVYQNIYNNYPNSNEARTIEKYIERAKLKAKK
jgi:tetratricopeptide (TPR) repeat protein